MTDEQRSSLVVRKEKAEEKVLERMGVKLGNKKRTYQQSFSRRESYVQGKKDSSKVELNGSLPK